MFAHNCDTTVVLTHLFFSRNGNRVIFESGEKSTGCPSLRSRCSRKIRLTFGCYYEGRGHQEKSLGTKPMCTSFEQQTVTKMYALIFSSLHNQLFLHLPDSINQPINPPLSHSVLQLSSLHN